MVEVINQQRKIKIETKDFEDFGNIATKKIANDKNCTIAFVSDSKIKELNKIFRSKDYATDVLSFPYEPDQFDFLETENFIGDITISLETAQRQAVENSLPFEIEIKQLILHGILHLLGYDHESDSGEMNELELKWRKQLKI